jgi:putative oxidoreductase
MSNPLHQFEWILLRRPRRVRGFLLREIASPQRGWRMGLATARPSCQIAILEFSRGYDMDQMLSKYQPVALSLFRLITGLLLFQYGVAKILKFPAVPQFADPPPLILTAGGLELVLGALLMIGLFTRLTAFILSGEMAFAYFLGHFPRGFLPLINNGTAAILFCFACLYLATAGGGPYSVDAMRGKTT